MREREKPLEKTTENQHQPANSPLVLFVADVLHPIHDFAV